MKKFKLIKEYPGSPSLGTEVKRNTNTSKNYSYSEEGRLFCVLSQHVEENSDYWEEVVDIWYVVLLKDSAFRNAWEVIQTTENPSVLEHKKYFKTREEADNFIIYNKPCLSLTEVQCIIGASDYYDMLVRYIKKNKL